MSPIVMKILYLQRCAANKDCNGKRARNENVRKSMCFKRLHKKIPFLAKRDSIMASANDHTLISTSTPEGSSNFISASTVLEEEE